MMDRQENILAQIMAMPTSEQASLAYTLENYLADQIPDQFPAQSSGMDYAFLAELERRSAHGKAHLSSLQSAGDVLASLRKKQQAERPQ